RRRVVGWVSPNYRFVSLRRISHEAFEVFDSVGCAAAVGRRGGGSRHVLCAAVLFRLAQLSAECILPQLLLQAHPKLHRLQSSLCDVLTEEAYELLLLLQPVQESVLGPLPGRVQWSRRVLDAGRERSQGRFSRYS